MSRSNRSPGPAYLGIDPGQVGGAVLQVRGRAVLGIAWKRVTRSKQKRAEVRAVHLSGAGEAITVHAPLPLPPGAPLICDIHPSIIGDLLLQHTRIALNRCGLQWGDLEMACEDAVIHKNPRVGLIIAWESGSLISPLECADKRKVKNAQRYKAEQWRKDILGLKSNSKREAAKAASLRHMPCRLRGLPAILDLLGRLDHLTDAAGISEMCRVQSNKGSRIP